VEVATGGDYLLCLIWLVRQSALESHPPGAQNSKRVLYATKSVAKLRVENLFLHIKVFAIIGLHQAQVEGECIVAGYKVWSFVVI